MARESKNNGASREGGESARRGRRRRGSSRGEPAEKAEQPVEEAPAEEQPAAATATDEKGDDGYEGVQFVGEDDGARRRTRRRRGGRRGRPDSEVEELGASAGIDVLEVRGDRQQRRDWGIEPGLTLKDLLPFLRPPKNLLVLGASTGSGHARVAASLCEAFKGLDRNLSVRQVDVLDHMAKAFRAPHVRTTLEDLGRCTGLFGTPFETTPTSSGDALPEDLEELREKVFDSRLDEQVVDKRPDWLVCTHWLPLKHLERLKAEERLTAEVIAVISDPAAHDLWVSDVVSQYLVPEDTHRSFLLKRGVDAGDVTVVGVPVSPSFQRPVDREAVLSELGISAQQPVVLLRPGGIGATERIVASVRRILELGPAHSLLVVAGKNDKLREEVEALDVPDGCTVRAFGFVQNIRDLMGVADLLISRASPHTVAEALAAGLPLVLLRPAPGMEDRLADDLLRRHVALKASSEDDLEALLKDLLKNRRRLREMQEAARTGRRADAACAAVDRISRVVR